MTFETSLLSVEDKHKDTQKRWGSEVGRAVTCSGKQPHRGLNLLYPSKKDIIIIIINKRRQSVQDSEARLSF